MIKRSVLFLSYAFVGALASYGALYAFTAYGAAILAGCLLMALLLPALDGDRLPEALGILAGPGLLAILIARNSDVEPAPWLVAGGAIVAAAVAAYAISGRSRCVRGRRA